MKISKHDLIISADAKNNRAIWDKHSEEYQNLHGTQLSSDEFVWGVWSIPESALMALGKVSGKDVLELGCGAAQLSISISKMGGNPTAIDNSENQLVRAMALLNKANISFPLYHSSAEKLPFDDSSFDLVFCDHGAMTFSPTVETLTEVNRVLRKGGSFVFNMQSPIHEICYNEETKKVDLILRRDYFKLNRAVDEDGMIYFQYSYGSWIKAFKKTGFDIVDLIELKAPENAPSSYDFVEKDWALKWPAENIWKLSKN